MRWEFCFVAVVLSAVSLSASANLGAASDAQSFEPGVHYVAAEPLCDRAPARHFRCLGLRLVPVTAGTPGAQPRTNRQVASTAAAGLSGPAGGYTPAALARAYGVNADAATSQIVGVVDAYDDPNALADLNIFDRQYGLPPETGTSFAKLSQTGSSTPPAPSAAWAGEISLDLDAVRGLCHRCRIILVEANSDGDADLAATENESVASGATVVTNSFGEAESTSIPGPIIAAFDHPGDVITAGSGDDGMDSWDLVNQGAQSAGAPFFPASLNTVVAVGGTTLELTKKGTRSYEGVWNENGDADGIGSLFQTSFGATGGGCSTQVRAPQWQTATTGWASTGCGAQRLSADIAAVADPFTGFDVYDSYQSSGWQVVGGTSLSSPLIAAMWAVAGGSGGVSYPALTLYGHVRSGSFYDVIDGGNGYCGGLPAAQCRSEVGQSPNTLGHGYLDCAFLPNSETPSGSTGACDATAGYDGPSGVGTPRGASGFVALAPVVTIRGPVSVAHGVPAKYQARAMDPIPGGVVGGSYSWSWGDGTTSIGATASHTFAGPGSYPVTVAATDNYGLIGRTMRTVTVN